jgi:hypothetical protein
VGNLLALFFEGATDGVMRQIFGCHVKTISILSLN